MQLNRKHKEVLNQLRNNSRKSFAKIGRELGMPVSTLFNYFYYLEKNYIKKHVAIVDFKKLGYGLKTIMLITTSEKDEFYKFIVKHQNMNNIYRIHGYDFYIEALFPSMKELYEFIESLERFKIEKFERYDIIKEIKYEDFRLK